MVDVAFRGRRERRSVVFENRDIRAMVESLHLKQVGYSRVATQLYMTNQARREFHVLRQLQFAEQFKVAARITRCV